MIIPVVIEKKRLIYSIYNHDKNVSPPENIFIVIITKNMRYLGNHVKICVI